MIVRHGRRATDECDCGARRFSWAHVVAYELGYARELLGAALRRWRRGRERALWLWCHACGHELNGDDASFVGEADGSWQYRCSACGVESMFDLSFPIPVRVER